MSLCRHCDFCHKERDPALTMEKYEAQTDTLRQLDVCADCAETVTLGQMAAALRIIPDLRPDIWHSRYSVFNPVKAFAPDGLK